MQRTDIECGPSNVTAEAGALAIREMVDLVGIAKFIAEKIKDPGASDKAVYPVEDLPHFIFTGNRDVLRGAIVF